MFQRMFYVQIGSVFGMLRRGLCRGYWVCIKSSRADEKTLGVYSSVDRPLTCFFALQLSAFLCSGQCIQRNDVPSVLMPRSSKWYTVGCLLVVAVRFHVERFWQPADEAVLLFQSC